jgi:hypothetical protein
MDGGPLRVRARARARQCPLKWWLPVAVAYEVAEQYVERSDVGQEIFDTKGPENIPNALLDVAVFAAGHQLGRLWNRTG